MSRLTLILLFATCGLSFGQSKFSSPITFSSNGVRDQSRENILEGAPGANLVQDPDSFSGDLGGTLHGLTVTTTSGATLTIASGKTLTVSNSMNLVAVDGSTLNIGSGGTLGSAAYTASTAYEVPLTFSTGLTRSSNTITLAADAARVNLTGGSGTLNLSGFTVTWPSIPWSSVSKTGSSIADLATRSAGDLNSGTLPDGRFPATLPAASGVNLTALNATQLTSGTMPVGRMPALTGGDATTSAGSGTITLANNAVTNAKAADMAANTIKGRVTASTGDPEDLTPAQALGILLYAAAATFIDVIPTGSQANIDLRPAAKGTGSVIINNGGLNSGLQVKGATDVNLFRIDLLNGKFAWGADPASTSSRFHFQGLSAGQTIMTMKAASGQTADAFIFFNEFDQPAFWIDKAGNVFAPSFTTTGPVALSPDAVDVTVDTSLALPMVNCINADVSSDEDKTITSWSASPEAEGLIYIFENTSATRSITFEHGTGNIICRGAADITIGPGQIATLKYTTSGKLSVQ